MAAQPTIESLLMIKANETMVPDAFCHSARLHFMAKVQLKNIHYLND